MKRLISVLIALTVGVSVFAQRTSLGESLLQSNCSLSLFPIAEAGFLPTMGFNLAYGQYALESVWYAGAEFNNFHQDTPYGWFDYSYYAVGADWNYRLLTNYSRSISFYVGGGCFLGYRQYGTFVNLPEGLLYNGISVKDKGGDFLYGFRANLQFEVFFLKRLAFIATVKPTLPLNTFLSSDTFHIISDMGLRLNF